MQTYDFFKQVSDLSMPDREAVRRAVLARPAASRRCFGAWYLAAAAVFAVIFAVGWAALPRLFSTVPDPAPLPPDPPGPAVTDAAESSDNADEPAEDPSEFSGELMADVHFNVLTDESVRPDMALARWVYDNAVEWDLNRVLEYLGRDPMPKDVPEGLLPAFDEDSRWMYSEKDDGTVWAQFGFTWRENPRSEVYDPLERSLTVTVSRNNLISDCWYVLPGEMTPSTLRGVSLYLGQRQMGYGPYTVVEDGPNIPAGYYDVYVAQFAYGGLYYDVTAENLTEEEFIETVASMLAAGEGAP